MVKTAVTNAVNLNGCPITQKPKTSSDLDSVGRGSLVIFKASLLNF